MALSDWRIDAWAVRDGAAFASRREEDSLEASSTIFVAVPDLEPVPVGRLSTALGATRRNFQAGLRDAEGREIPFADLEQVRELVRRGFLAGGLGPGGSGAPAMSPPEPGGGGLDDSEPRPPGDQDGPSSDGALHFEEGIAGTGTSTRRWRDDSADARQALAGLGADPGDPEGLDTLRRLAALIDCYAQAITINWERRVSAQSTPAQRELLLEWYRALIRAGVWRNAAELGQFVDETDCSTGRALVPREGSLSHSVWAILRTREPSAVTPQELMSHAPCPRRVAWVDGLSRFCDKVVLPMCAGQYYETNPYLPELAPAALGAVLLSAARLPGDLVPQDEAARRPLRMALGMALGWLASQLPGVALPAEAERLITEYAWRQVEVAQPMGSH